MMRNPERATVSSVAKAAKVSRASVYAVLNATKNINIRVSEKIEKRILQVADELGYVRNENARMLVTGKTNTIGVMLTGMENQFFDPMLKEIYRIGDGRGYSISVSFSSWDMERERRGISGFCGNRFEGIIWVPITPGGDDFKRNIGLIESMNIPLLLIGTYEYPESDNRCQVGIREEESVSTGIEYLSSLGHRRIGIATATATECRRRNMHEIRLGHMRKLASDAGMIIYDRDIFNTSDNAYGGVGFAAEILRRPRSSWPTAIFAADDMLARGLIAGLSCLGVKVPDQISVLGFDDSPGNETAGIPVTSVSLETAEMGRRSLPLLLDVIERKLPDGSPQRIILKTRLVERKSCSSPPMNRMTSKELI
ncbi:MAG: hypothetical protein A2X45_07550 [Lentisphaerae bacterium GWF2_50_93]|nr:MAG: hypothetical protein A2X45_07550 [Lentisphaerae bacterium GWF2_50_93]